MADHPIIFSGPMVRATFDGRKTHHCAMVGKQLEDRPGLTGDGGGMFWKGHPLPIGSWRKHLVEFHSPFGVPGDRLYVKETWCPALCKYHDTGNPADHGSDDDPCCGFRTTMTYKCGKPIPDNPLRRWRAATCMPRRFARLWLENCGERIMLVQEISEIDALAEGVEPFEAGQFTSDTTGARHAFRYFWDSLHAKQGHGWDANPWVRAITFERIEVK